VPGLPTVLLPAFRRVSETGRALESLRREGSPPVILVDDEGTAGSAELRDAYPGLEVVATPKAVYWTGAISLAARKAVERGDEKVLFFNQDVTVEPGYFEAMEKCTAVHPGAIVGSAVLYRHDPSVTWSAGGATEWWLRGSRVLFHGASAADLPRDCFPVEWLFGMGTLVPCSVFEKAGFPDGERFPMAWGDFDFSVRARARGVPLIVEPRARLVHDVGSYDARSAGAPSLRKYVSWLSDPHHNISLLAQREIWRRHGPRRLWPAAYSCHVGFLLANWVRMQLLFRNRSGRYGQTKGPSRIS
jgi:GT2 family glycosyltransferase